MDEAANRKPVSLSPGEVDFVLVYTKENPCIERFLYRLQHQYEFTVETEALGEYTYIKLRASFHTLCSEAENIKLEMPLAGAKASKPNVTFVGLNNWIERNFVTDDEDDYVSAPFIESELVKFKGHKNKNTFFRRSLRSLLVRFILCNMDVPTRDDDDDDDDDLTAHRHHCAPLAFWRIERNSNFKKKKGLNYFLMKDIFTDYLVLHEDPDTLALPPRIIHTPLFPTEARKDTYNTAPSFSCTSDKSEDPSIYSNLYSQSVTGSLKKIPGIVGRNQVTEMREKWTSFKNFYKFQPLWKIRNYFGEKIAFYFAWTGMLVSSLWIPTFIGLLVFVYGLTLKFRMDRHIDNLANTTVSLGSKVVELMHIIHLTFDNDMTPYFAMIVCIWGTVFLECWKRRSARLAYEWDVNNFQDSEPDRPQFIGTACKDNPVGDEKLWYYPFRLQLGKFMISVIVVLLMICIVAASLVGIIVYRVTMDIDVCPVTTGEQCLLLRTVLSAVLNAVSITALEKVYYHIAVWLTKIENHKTRSKYDDALIIKLFAFQFANSYSSCFYIAFFIERVDTSVLLGLGERYRDTCEGTCMSQLTFQIIALMIIKPLPKFFMDVILPKLQKAWRRCTCSLSGSCCTQTKRDCGENVEVGHPLTSHSDRYTTEHKHCVVCKGIIRPIDDNGTNKHVLCGEREKPELGDFTLDEYTEKVIQYGYLMLFAASFPLAPLFALLTNLIDIQVDGWRMLTMYRRPIAFRAQNIGIWHNILTFVNYCGVLSNAFLVAFTSSWGQEYDIVAKLIIIIAFEHIVFVLKFILTYLIPDVPVDVQEAIRNEKYETRKIFQAGRFRGRRKST